MFRHVVMFRFVDELDPAAVDAISAGLDSLPSQIPQIRSYVHGPDAAISDGNFDYVVVADFDDEASFVTYRDHPAHQSFIAERITANVRDRAAVQYSVEV